MAARRGRVARRFSDTSLEVLVAAVRARAALLFPPGNKKLQSGLAKRGWQEVAQEVSRLSITPRSWIQCRKRFNDLSRSAREKAAHNMRERNKTGGGTTDIVALTPVEQSAMDISGTSRGISIGDGEAGGFSKHNDCFPVVPLRAPLPVNAKTSASPPEPSPPPQEEDSLEEDGPPEGVQSVATSLQTSSAEIPTREPARGESEGLPNGTATAEMQNKREPEQPLAVGPGPVTPRRRAWSTPSSAKWHRDTDLRDPAIKRKRLEAHHRLYEVLEGLPKTLGTMSENMEESTSAMCGVVSHVVSTLQTTMESATTSRGSAGKPPQQEPTPPTIEALIAAQTASIQTLGSNICSTLERLVGQMDSLVDHVGKGFQMISHLLQSALPQISGSEEAKPDGRATGQVCVALVQETNGVSPPPQPIPDIVPNSHQGQAAAELPQLVTIPSRARAPRGQWSRTSPGCQDQSEQPPATCFTASPGPTSRRSGKNLPEEEVCYAAVSLSPVGNPKGRAAADVVYAEVRQEGL